MNEDIESYISNNEQAQSNNDSSHQREREREIQTNYTLQEERISLLKSYREDDKLDRKNRNTYAWVFIVTVIVQLISINTMVILQGMGKFKLEATIFNVFLVGIFVELAAIVKIIFNNLFPADYNKNKSDTQRSLLLDNKNNNE